MPPWAYWIYPAISWLVFLTMAVIGKGQKDNIESAVLMGLFWPVLLTIALVSFAGSKCRSLYRAVLARIGSAH